MGPIGVPELSIILVIIVIIFGVGKLPEIGGALGKGIREFKSETRDPAPPPQATTPLSDVTVTDVQARPLDADPVAAAPERDHRA